MAKKGGKRIGAGRPKGSKTLIRAIDFFSEKELKDFWENLKKRAKDDTKIALYFAEQFTGKAVQAVELGGEGGGPVQVEVVAFTKK